MNHKIEYNYSWCQWYAIPSGHCLCWGIACVWVLFSLGIVYVWVLFAFGYSFCLEYYLCLGFVCVCYYLCLVLFVLGYCLCLGNVCVWSIACVWVLFALGYCCRKHFVCIVIFLHLITNAVTQSFINAKLECLTLETHQKLAVGWWVLLLFLCGDFEYSIFCHASNEIFFKNWASLICLTIDF